MYFKSLLLFLFSLTALFATNSGLFLGYGTSSNAMGGVGVATFTGTDSALKNPAILSFNGGDSANIARSFYSDNSHFDADNNTSVDFLDDIDSINGIGYLHNINKSLVVAFHSAHILKSHVNYRDVSSTDFIHFESQQAIVDTAISLSYKFRNFALAWSTIITDGSLRTYDDFFWNSEYEDSTSFGYQFGLAYQNNSLTYGLTFKSERVLLHKSYNGSNGDYYNEMPAELAMGVAFEQGDFLLAFDLKEVFWSDTKLIADSGPNYGYEEGFAIDGFSNQLVFALGSAYKISDITYRLGFNYAATTISDDIYLAGALFEYSRMQEGHLTAGFSYDITKDIIFDMASVFALRNETHLPSAITPSGTIVTNVNYSSESVFTSLGLKYRF
jgi:long-chain fatty acid transport protein